MTARDDYIAGLRTLAALLDTNPDVPLPYDGGTRPRKTLLTSPISFYCHNVADLGALLDAFEDHVVGHVVESGTDGVHRWGIVLDGCHVQIVAFAAAWSKLRDVEVPA